MIIELLHRLVKYRFYRLGFRTNYVDINSCRIHYVNHNIQRPSGQIIFIHGAGTSMSTWIRILPLMNPVGSITCVDLPGHGLSRFLSGDSFFPMDIMENTLEQFMGRLYSEQVTIIGHSLGGWLAGWYAINHPASVKRLILINNAGIRYPGVARQAEAFNFCSSDDVRKLLNLMWHNMPWYFSPFIPSIYRSLQKKHIGEIIKSINEGHFLNKSLNILKMPVDIIWGKEDHLISEDSLAIMSQAIPRARIHYIHDCGHVPQLEQPSELASILNTILATF